MTITTKDQVDLLFQISNLLNTSLSKQTIATCMEMIELGINPEALVMVLREISNSNTNTSTTTTSNTA
jgi:mitotic-spindle organizing protein 1